MNRATLRDHVATLFASTPRFRGKGRIVLLCDRFLTDPLDTTSYLATAVVNTHSILRLDLRVPGQKFAYYYRELEGTLLRDALELYRPGVFVDVGASIGLWSIAVGRYAQRTGGRVVAIEPVPHHRQRLEENVRLNDLSGHIDIVPVAAGADERTVTMTVNPLLAADNAYISSSGELEVEVVPVDRVLEERRVTHVTLIKIDTEGYDPLVLAGAARTIRRDRPVVFCEFLRDRMNINQLTIEDSWDLLVRQLGYRCAWSSPRGLVPVDHPGDRENLFFLPPPT